MARRPILLLCSNAITPTTALERCAVLFLESFFLLVLSVLVCCPLPTNRLTRTAGHRGLAGRGKIALRLYSKHLDGLDTVRVSSWSLLEHWLPSFSSAKTVWGLRTFWLLIVFAFLALSLSTALNKRVYTLRSHPRTNITTKRCPQDLACRECKNILV